MHSRVHDRCDKVTLSDNCLKFNLCHCSPCVLSVVLCSSLWRLLSMCVVFVSVLSRDVCTAVCTAVDWWWRCLIVTLICLEYRQMQWALWDEHNGEEWIDMVQNEVKVRSGNKEMRLQRCVKAERQTGAENGGILEQHHSKHYMSVYIVCCAHLMYLIRCAYIVTVATTSFPSYLTPSISRIYQFLNIFLNVHCDHNHRGTVAFVTYSAYTYTVVDWSMCGNSW